MTERAEYKVNRGQYSTTNMELPDKFHIIQTAMENCGDYITSINEWLEEVKAICAQGREPYMVPFSDDEWNGLQAIGRAWHSKITKGCQDVIDCEMEALKNAG